jgi:ribose transport system permease protein
MAPCLPSDHLAVLILISAIILYRTPFGRRLYAVGGNREAARFTGIRWIA